MQIVLRIWLFGYEVKYLMTILRKKWMRYSKSITKAHIKRKGMRVLDTKLEIGVLLSQNI